MVVPSHSYNGLGTIYVLPLYVGYNAAREFKGTQFLGRLQEACHLVFQQCHFLKTDAGRLMPFTGKAFNPGAGGH